MSNYQFAPSPNFGLSEHPFVSWEKGFTNEDIAEIIKVCESRQTKEAGIGTENQSNDVIRRSKVSWLELAENSQWIYDKIAYIVRNLNGKFYNFDIHGFVEDMQFTIYDSEQLGHYNWHQDIGASNSSPRKLSFVLQLSDPSEYEGGDLELFHGVEPAKVKKEKGFAVVFPSYMLHRVTPVTSGIRKTLVVWVAGPTFR